MSTEWGYGAALLFGLAGSLSHCVAMCGGFSLALASGRHPAPLRVAGYHAGRLVTYMSIGALVGLTGSLVNAVGASTGALRSASSVAGGLVMVATGLGMLGVTRWVPEQWVPSAWIRKLSGPLFQSPSAASGVLLGLVLGFLPCGLVYSAASFSLASGSPLRGALLMLAFGAGTIPALAGATLVFRKARHLTHLFTRGAGVWLLLSGTYCLVRGFPG